MKVSVVWYEKTVPVIASVLLTNCITYRIAGIFRGCVYICITVVIREFKFRAAHENEPFMYLQVKIRELNFAYPSPL